MPHALPRLTRLATAATLSLTALLGPVASAHAGSAIGGDALGATGVIAQPLAGATPLPTVTASSYLLADLDTGEVLAARNPHGRFAPASTLKVLTAVTLIPLIPPAMPLEATYDDTAVDGTRVGEIDHTKYKAEDLFLAMLMVSGNDAALTLSRGVGGPVSAIAKMNALAQHLQALDTTAKTVNGLDAKGQFSSAYDLALFGRAGLAMPAFARYVGTKTAFFPAPRRSKFQMDTHNRLLWNYAGAIGVKNGYTVAAEASFVGAAQRNGHRLIVTLMHSNVGTAVWHEAAALLDWGFANEAKVTPVGTLVGPVPPPGTTTSPAATTPAVAAVTTPADSGSPAPQTVGQSLVGTANGTVALVGGAGAGVLLAGVGALWLARRRREVSTVVLDEVSDVGRKPRGRKQAAPLEIIVPPQPEPTYTSVRIRRSTD